MKKQCQQKAISIYPFWVICDLMVNYIQIQDFVELPCISLLWHAWNDTENVLENCVNILEKVLEKCLNFFWKSVLTMFAVANQNIDGLVQDCGNSIANALELPQSCSKPSIWTPRIHLAEK